MYYNMSVNSHRKKVGRKRALLFFRKNNTINNMYTICYFDCVLLQVMMIPESVGALSTLCATNLHENRKCPVSQSLFADKRVFFFE